MKAEGMTQFDIFHVFVENSVNSELCSNQQKFEIYPKMPLFKQLKKQGLQRSLVYHSSAI
jgi:hypothetical protein